MGSAYKDIYNVVRDSAKTFKSPEWLNVFMKIHGRVEIIIALVIMTYIVETK